MQPVQPLDVSTTRQELRLQNGNLQGGYAHNGNDEMKVKEKKQSAWCVHGLQTFSLAR